MDIGYIDKIDPWTGNPDKYFDIKNTSLQDIYDMVGTPKELQNKLTELTKGHPSLPCFQCQYMRKDAILSHRIFLAV